MDKPIASGGLGGPDGVLRTADKQQQQQSLTPTIQLTLTT